MVFIELLREVCRLDIVHEPVIVKVYNPETEQYEPLKTVVFDKVNKILYLHSDKD